MNINAETLYQWDTDRQIELDLDMEEHVDEVHFSNLYTPKALIVEAKENIANIPNILLQRCASIHIYVVVYTDDGKHTVFTKNIPVIGRSKPADYVYTETQVKRYELLEERIKNIEEKAGTVKTVNGEEPDENGNIETPQPDFAEENVESKAFIKNKPLIVTVTGKSGAMFPTADKTLAEIKEAHE